LRSSPPSPTYITLKQHLNAEKKLCNFHHFTRRGACDTSWPHASRRETILFDCVKCVNLKTTYVKHQNLVTINRSLILVWTRFCRIEKSLDKDLRYSLHTSNCLHTSTYITPIQHLNAEEKLSNFHHFTRRGRTLVLVPQEQMRNDRFRMHVMYKFENSPYRSLALSSSCVLRPDFWN